MASLLNIVLLLSAISGTLAFWPFTSDTPTGPLWNDLRVTYSPLGWLNGFTRLPRTSADAKKDGWSLPPEESVTDIEILCPKKDPSVCVIFDKAGSVAGIQMGNLKTDLENKGYPYDKHPMFVPMTRFGYKVYVTTLFTVEQSTLKGGGRASMADNGTGIGLWLQNGPTRDLMMEVPRFEKNIGKTAYTKESCIPGMGRHYYYNVSESMACEDFEPIFALYKAGELIGFGYQTFGKITPISHTYYESIPTFAIKPTIPNTPQCLIDWANKQGIVSLHVYFVDKPWDITCTSTD